MSQRMVQSHSNQCRDRTVPSVSKEKTKIELRVLIFLHNYYAYVLNVLISQRIFGLYIEVCQPSAGWMSESEIKVVTRLVPDFL